MPSIRYINQTAPFWDFVASLENGTSTHPFFNRDRQEAGEEWAPHHWHHGGMPHRGGPPHGRHGPPHHYHGRRGPPGPPGPPPPEGAPHHPPPPPGYEQEASPDTLMGEHEKTAEDAGAESQNEAVRSGSDNERRERCRRGGRGGPEGRCGRGHGHNGGPGSARHHRGGPWGGRPGSFPWGGPFGLGRWAEFLPNAFTEAEGSRDANASTTPRAQEDFKPEADVFDTEVSYVVHLSLAGVKKDDIGVSYDPEISELTVSGVIHRPGDEDFLKTLAMDERRVGAFERKVRLGSRANPAQVDADSISAKLEDGVLIVEVPKLDKDYVEIKKVDIE